MILYVLGGMTIKTSFYTANQITHHHPKVIAYYYKEWQDFQMPFHTHEAIEIMYVISGSCHVEVEQEMIPMKQGDMILIDANVSHRLLVNADQTCRMLNIEFILNKKTGAYPSIKELASENKDLNKLLRWQEAYLMLKDTEGLYYTLRSLVLELSEQHKVANATVIQTLISHVILLIARMAVEARERKPLSTDVHIKRVIEYIHHNYDRDLRISELASAVYLHPSYLQRIFKKRMNMTIMAYITDIRIGKAKMLLSKTDISIADISDFVGINSRQYFSFLFKKTTGQTPQGYRQKR